MNHNHIDWNHYLDEDGLFVKAFAPLQQRLNAQAEQCRRDPKIHDGFSPWIIHCGKGGKPQYIKYYDISLYRHCMDVAIAAFMIFVHAWHGNKIPHPDHLGKTLQPHEEEKALQLLTQLFAIAFLHDADKYCGAEQSTSPTLSQVTVLHKDLEVEQWTNLDAKTSWALVSIVEKTRGIGNAQTAGIIPPLTQQKLAEMVGWGDVIVSEGSQGGIPQMVAAYNDSRRLAALRLYNVPQLPLKLLTFRYHPVILHRLQYAFLEDFYANQIFPLVCLLDGQLFHITVPEGYDLTAVFQNLESYLAPSRPNPGFKRVPTNGEITLYHVHQPQDLIEAVTNNQENKLLAIKKVDWEKVFDGYIKGWASEEKVTTFIKGEGGLLPTVTVAEEGHKPPAYLYALVIATALRANDSSKKTFEQRVQRLLTWNDQILVSLQRTLPAVNLEDLQKDTRQTLFALAAAQHIKGEKQLLEAIAACYGTFPEPPLADAGAMAILSHLKAQCGSGEVTDTDSVYTTQPAWGTCLLCGTPTDMVISDKMKKPKELKSSAFNNRIGHRKSLWSQSDSNYLCPACLKLQEEMLQEDSKLNSAPLLVATPFRGLIKGTSGSSEESAITAFKAVSQDDWKKVLPWNLDTSGHFPLKIESVEPKFDEVVNAMYRWALFALLNGNPVHVFISAQRESKAAFLFEHTPPLLSRLLADLSVRSETLDQLSPTEKQRLGETQLQELKKTFVPMEQGTIRRHKLPQLVKRLELFKDVLRTSQGHNILTAMPLFGWWTVAWLQQVSGDNSKHMSMMINLAQQEYPMNQHEESSKLEHIAYLAAQLQRFPGYDASNNDKIFCLDIVLNQLDTSKHYPLLQEERTIIAGMAGELQKRFASGKERYAGRGEGGSFPQRCENFAEAVYHFIQDNAKHHRLDTRFRRFLLAAYSHLFMAKSQEHSAKNRELEGAEN